MTLVDAMKFSMAVAETPAFQRYGVRMWDLPFPGCDHYKHLSDENLACMARSFTNTIYHPVGTAKMGPVWDPTTVVDPKLRVKGVQRLRVIDASIMPTIVSGNTNAPSIMIGEKGADIVKAAWAHHSNFHQQLHEAAKRKRYRKAPGEEAARDVCPSVSDWVCLSYAQDNYGSTLKVHAYAAFSV
ncbi:hypothetical protein MTO96_040214 [Rhipicephalus appendiculatus]